MPGSGAFAMRLYTPVECARWCEFMGIGLDERRKPTRELGKKHRLRFGFPRSFTQSLWFSRRIEHALRPRQSCMLWVTGYGVFPSNENEHLYYRLRQSYGDLRLLHEAPGHLCLAHEEADVVTLLHLCVLSGWDVHLIPTGGDARAFVCHDEWAEIGFDAPGQMEETRRALEDGGLKVFESE